MQQLQGVKEALSEARKNFAMVNIRGLAENGPMLEGATSETEQQLQEIEGLIDWLKERRQEIEKELFKINPSEKI